ncbi:MAG TPA: hypothetical protein VF538_03195 [Pyrinomonadaceae bacterium]|jgi:hypothetical protein
MSGVYAFLRYFVAFVVITYGFAKLNGAQFTILQSELDKPLGEVSGFWLTWHYFGYSKVYGGLIALVQIGAGVLLMFRKTTLIAICVLLPVIANIILVDVFYGVDLGGLLAALTVGACLAALAGFHKEELVGLFWSRQNSVFPERRLAAGKRALRFAARALALALPALLTYYAANYNNRLPTPLDGRWRVVDGHGVALGREPLTYVYFERNRAYMCVFRYGAATWQTHHFEIDEKTGRLGIWDRWLTKGDEIFDGTFKLDGNRLVIEGRFGNPGGATTIELEK